jgi:polygalacturonase
MKHLMRRQNTVQNRSTLGYLCLLALTAASIPAVAFADPTLPTIPAGTFTVPLPTGVATTDTQNLTATLSAAAANGGGTVIVQAGTGGITHYLCSQFSIPSNINLQLSTGANIWNASPLNTLISIGSGHDIEITGSGTIDGRATTTKGANLISIRHVNNLLISGVTICNSSHCHLVPEVDTNLTIDGININDTYTKSMNGGAYLGNTDGIDYSGSHILIKNCTINDGDDDIVAKPQSTFCSDILITNCTIGDGHGISVGGSTNAGLDGLTVKNCTFNGTDNGLRLKAGPKMLDGAVYNNGQGLGGVVKNVSFSDITMTNVTYPIVINSWYVGGDSYGYSQIGRSSSSLHNLTNPTETLHTVDQQNNSAANVPFYDNIRYTNITATGNKGSNVAIIYGLDSQPPPGNPNGDPLKNIDNVSFNNVSLSGSYGAAIYYASRLDVSGLHVSTMNQYGSSTVLPSYTDYTIWQGGNTTAPGANYSPTDWNNQYNWTSDLLPGGQGVKVAFGNQDESNSIVDMITSSNTVGSIYYSPDTSTTIQSSGGYSLILNNGSNASVIDVRGSQTISAPVLLSSDVNITGTGSLTLSGGISGAHTVNVQGGNLTVASINVSTLTIASGLTVTIQPIPGGHQASNENLQSVPEPSTLALLGIIIIGLLAYHWRRRKRGT